MIQIYNIENTNFDQNGDMSLFPSSASVHAVLNGTWEVTLEHPKDSEDRWKYIKEGAVVKMPSFNGEQLFRVTHKEKSDSGISADLQPIFMDAADDCFLLDVRPTDKTGQQALDIMTAPNKKYTAETDITSTGTAYYQNKNLIEAINGDDENSFVKRWGGEIVYDNYKAIINRHAGSDRGVEILYGKNIAENGMKEEVDLRNVVTRIIPQAYNGYQIEGDAPWVDSPLIDKYPTVKYSTMKFENVKMRADAQEDDESKGVIICDTPAQLEAALRKRCQEQWEAGADKPQVTISVDMVMIEDTELYADVKGLVEVSLGDTVHCRNNNLDIVTDARVTELEWDCVNDRILSVSLGDYQFDYISNQVSINNRIESAIREDGSVIGSQVQGILDAVKTQFHALRDVAQKQDVRAMLFEDLNPDSPTFGAMCLGSMGFEIASKRTSDGKDWIWSTFGTGQGFFADYIIAGTMLADRIYGGTLTLGGRDNKAGIMKILNGSGAVMTTLDKDGILTNGRYTCGSDEFGRRAEISDGEMKIMDKSGNTVGRIFAVSNEIFKIGTENALFRMFKTGKVYVDCQSFGVNGYNGFTGTVEYSDGTYEDYVGGLLVGGKSKEGVYP
ncbi:MULTISPECIES: phage tail spike protein [Agathobacter]|mgnify:FL=1|uniref:phage tail spike protein n=1 Tax=Agathobacter TaxID=1766253 RepID=UPI0027D30C3E|nr:MULTISPECIES: phage tail spike protein [Agathobacter]